MEILKFGKIDGRPEMLLIVEDLDRIKLKDKEVAALAALLEPECALLVRMHSLRAQAQDWMSARIKRGVQAARERRKKK